MFFVVFFPTARAPPGSRRARLSGADARAPPLPRLFASSSTAMSALAPFFARRLLQIPQVPGDVVDAPQDALPGNAAAAGLAVEDTLDSGDAAWMMTSTALVVMMSIPGLALFYGGLVRPKNVLSAFANVLTCVAVVTLVWVFYGYSIAFSAENMAAGEYSVNSFFGTLRHGGLRDVGLFASTGSYPATVFVTFHLTFAAITTALVTGAFAERMKPTGCLWFAVGWSTLVYCPLAHQVWGGDGAFVHSFGAVDFAGGLVVHVSSGVAGLVASLMLGKRIGYPRVPKAPHSLVLTHVGGAMLWVGWFGFNAGSATAADFVAGRAMLVTQIASASGAVAWSVVERYSYGRPSSLGMISGAISGLVGITPAAGSVGAMPAVCVGAVAGAACFAACTFVKEAFGTYDDSLDVFGIHGVGGIVGALLTAFWCAPLANGSGFGVVVKRGGSEAPIREVGTQLGVQAASVAWAACWSAIGTAIVLKFVDVCHGGAHARLWNLKNVRSTPKEEEAGLDDSYFAERGYNFNVEDSAISVEVGPLRAMKGHGLQMYYTDDEGTRHPITYDQEAVDAEPQREAAARIEAEARPHARQTGIPRGYHDQVAAELAARGGVVGVRRRGDDGGFVVDTVELAKDRGERADRATGAA